MTVGRLVVLVVLGLGVCLVLVGPAGAVSAGDGADPVPRAGVDLGGVVAQGVGLCDSSGVAQFGDVSVEDYGAGYVLCMRALGLSLGTGDGTYGPDRELTRGQMASFLVRLWRDVLGMGCPEGGTPFTDVAGSVHADNIECLYNLGITLGKTATSYAPRSDLTASQISRFLFRTYEKAGRSCEDRDSELDEAVVCLEKLRVIPSAVEGRSDQAVTRAQMAVYMIGLWHNVAGRGLPPVPPAFGAGSGVGPEDGVSDPDEGSDVLEGPGDGDAGEPIDGDWVIPVFVCAPAGKYTAADLGEWTDVLNDELDGFFERLSGGRMTLRFAQGSVLTDDIDWGNTSRGILRHAGVFPCGEEATRRSGTSQVLIFADVGGGPTEGGTGGYARLRTGPAMMGPTPSTWAVLKANFQAFLELNSVVVHELAHSVLGFPHLKEGYSGGDVFLNEGSIDSVSAQFPSLACYQYEQLGWSVPDYAQPCRRLTPSPPESVSYGQTDNDGAAVTWEPPGFSDGAPITGYVLRFYRGGYAYGVQPYAVVQKPADARYHVLDQSIEPDYYFVTVEAYSKYGEGDRGSVGVDWAPLPPPYGSMRVTDITHGTIHLAWNTESHRKFRDETNTNINYEIAHTANGQTSYEETWGGSGDTTVFRLTDLEPDTKYTIRVRACSRPWSVKRCTSWKTTTASTATAGAVPPPAPISVTAGSDWYLLTWDPVPGAGSYLIELPHGGQRRIPGPDFEQDDGIEPDTSYSLKVRSCRSPTFSCEDGEWTAVTFTTASEPTVPPPYRVALREIGDSWVTLMWETRRDSRWLYREEYEYTDGTTSSGLLHRPDQGETPLQLTVEPNRTYTLKIRNCELAEPNSACSTWTSFTFSTFPASASVSPPSVRVTDLADVWAEFSWDHIAGVMSYDWRYKKTADPTRWRWGNEPEPSVELQTYIEPDTAYTVQVRSCGEPTKPCSNWATTTVTTAQSLPPAPPSYPVSVKDVTDTQIHLAWNQPRQYYQFRWYPTDERGRTYINNDLAYTDTVIFHLEPGTTYTIALRACHWSAGGSLCDNWVTLNATTRPRS